MDPKKMDTETSEMIVKRVSVPVGLEELMEGLAKEVLLKKPEDLYLFAAKYFSQLLLLREKTSYKVKAVRSAQSVIEPSRKWSSRNYVPRTTTKELSRQMSVRGDSPRKDSISKIPQKDKLSFKKDKDKIAEAPEPFALEGKKYISNRSNTRNSRNVSIERPKNIHHRERSLNSTEKNNVAQPLLKQRKNLQRESKIKQQVDENNKHAGGASDSFENLHKSVKAEQSIKTTDKIDTELPKKPVVEQLLPKASFDRIQDIDKIEPEKTLSENKHESETGQENSTNMEVIKNQIKEIIPKQEVVHAIEKNNFEDLQTTEKKSYKTPTKYLETKVDEQTTDSGLNLENITEQHEDKVRDILRDDGNKIDKEAHTENSLKFVTDALKVCNDITEEEDHETDHAAHSQHTETGEHIISKDVSPLEMVTDIQNIDNEIKEGKHHKIEPEVHTENTENDRHVSKIAADTNPLDLVTGLTTAEQKIKNENGHNKNDGNKEETKIIETPIITSEKQTEVREDFNTTSSSSGEAEHIKSSKTVLDNKIREISNLDETKNKQVLEKGSNEAHDIQQILVSQIDGQKINGNISKSITNSYNNVGIENGEPEKQKNINTIQNQEIKKGQESSSSEKININNLDQEESSTNNQQTDSNHLIKELNKNVITAAKHDKGVAEENHSGNSTENVKILQENDSNFDSKFTTQNQSSIDEKINDEVKTGNNDIFQKCEELKTEEDEKLTDEVNIHHRVTRSLNKIDEESTFDEKKINEDIQSDKQNIAQVAEPEDKSGKVTEAREGKRPDKGHIDEKNGETLATFFSKDNAIDKDIIDEKPDNSLEKKHVLYEKKENQGENENVDIIEVKNDSNKEIVDKHEDKNGTELKVTDGILSNKTESTEGKETNKNEENKIETKDEGKYDTETKVTDGVLSNKTEGIEGKETNKNEENNIETKHKGKDDTETKVTDGVLSNKTESTEMKETNNIYKNKIEPKDEDKDVQIIDDNKASISEDKNAITDKENVKESKNIDHNPEIYSNDKKKALTDEKIHSFDNNEILAEKDTKLHTGQKDSRVETPDNTERHLDNTELYIIGENILTQEGSRNTEENKLVKLNKSESTAKEKESRLQKEKDDNEGKNQSIDNKVEFDDAEKEIISENIEKKEAVTLQSGNEKNKDENKSLENKPEFDNEKNDSAAIALNASEGTEKEKAETLSVGIESKEEEGALQSGKEKIDNTKKESNGDTMEKDVNEKLASLENIDSTANEEEDITQSGEEQIEDDMNTFDTEKESDKDDIEKGVVDKQASLEKAESIEKVGPDTSVSGKEKIENEDKNLVTKKGSDKDNIENNIMDENVASLDKRESIEEVEVATSPSETEQIESEDKKLDTKKESEKDNTEKHVIDENVASLEKYESIEKVKPDTSQSGKEKIEDNENNLDNKDDSDKDNIEKNVIDEKVASVEKNKNLEKIKADISQNGKEKIDYHERNLDAKDNSDKDNIEENIIGENVVPVENNKNIEKIEADISQRENEKIEDEGNTLDSKKEFDKDNIERDVTNEKVVSVGKSKMIEKVKADTLQGGKKKIGDDENNLDTKDDSDKDDINKNVIDENNENIDVVEGDISQSGKTKIENNEKDIDDIQKEVIDEKVASLPMIESTERVEDDDKKEMDAKKNFDEHNNENAVSDEKATLLENNESNEKGKTETLQGEKEKSENREKKGTETSPNEKEIIGDHNNILDIIKDSDKDDEKTVTDEKVPSLEISESTEKTQANTLSSENENNSLDDKVKLVNYDLYKKELKNDQNLKEDIGEILPPLEKKESIEQAIAFSGKESNNLESNKEINTNKDKNKVSETKITSLGKSENMEREGGDKTFDENNQQINDVTENEAVMLHQKRVINEDKNKHTEISTGNKKEGIDDTENMLSQVESVDKNKVDALDKENNKGKESKNTNLAKIAVISNVEETVQMFQKQVQPLLEANLSVKERDVENKNLETTENHSDNNDNESLPDNNKSREQHELDSKNNNLLINELQKNDKDVAADNNIQNLNEKGDAFMDENQNTTKTMSISETTKNNLNIEKCPTKLVNETDEDREIAKKILGEPHKNDIKINREDLDTNKQIQVNNDKEKGKNGLTGNEQKPPHLQEDIDDKEAIDATIAAIKAGVISKVVKDYINNFIDNEKVISSKPNQEASKTGNINKSEKSEKRTMSSEENKNEINVSKTALSVPEKPVENKIDSKHIYNITANLDYDKDKYKEKLSNKTLAVLKIQSLWRGFIVRKNLNIFNTYFDNDHEHEHDQMQINKNVEKVNKINGYSHGTVQKSQEEIDTKVNNEENNKIFGSPNLAANIKDEAKSDNKHVEEGNMNNEEISERKAIDHFRDDKRKTTESEASEEDKSDGEQQDRPKTTDSVVTVISKTDKENKADELADLLIDPEAESEGEHLIAAQQSHILDQISGKNDANVLNKDYSSQEESETGREFCKVQPPNNIIKTTSLPEDVECISKDNETAEPNSEHAVQLERVVSTQEHTPSSKLLHTGELHDTVMVPLSSETHDQDKNNSIQEASENSKPSLPVYTPKGLLHTSELHDSVIIPTEVWNRDGYEENEVTGLDTANTANGAVIKDHVAVESQDKTNIMQEALKSSKPSSPDYTSKCLLHTSELHDGVIVPTGVWNTDGYEENKVTDLKVLEPDTTNNANITASSLQSPPTSTVDVDSIDKARAPSRSDSASSGPGHQSSELRGMEKQNAEVHEFTDKNMEAAAATKIQAGFRGYQVRKELKHKAEHSDAANQRTSNKIKSTGRNSGNRKDLEEKSAVKIQAGVRGFLVRKRQKKQKNPDTKQP